MSSSPKSLDSSSALELLFSPGDKRKGRKRKILLKSIEKTVQISISFLVALLCFYGIYRAIDDTHPETLAKIPKFGSSGGGGGGHFLHHRHDDDEVPMSSGSSARKRFSGKSSRLVDSLANDLSRAKTALTDAKIHERAIEVELMETRARERSIYQEAETLKSKLIGATRDQVEDVVEDVDELLRDWEFELGDPVEMEHASPPPSEAMVKHEEAKEEGMGKKVKVGEKASELTAAEREQQSKTGAGSSGSSSDRSRSSTSSGDSSSSRSGGGSSSSSSSNNNVLADDASLGTCEAHEHTEYWGAVVLNGDNHKTEDAGKCCDACRNLNRASGNRCNVWVYNPNSKACWLKFEKNIKEMKPANSGAGVPWVAGKFTDLKPPKPPQHPPATGKRYEDMPRCLHGVMTSSGNAYMNWQSRIMYQTWQNHASQPGSIMKAFTRVLHKGRDDELMVEIPTMRFEPIQTHCDSWCDYPVADRSSAIARWSQTSDSETCSHIVMLETDHVIVKSPPESILLPPGQAYGFEFTYINVNHPTMRSHFSEEYGDKSKGIIPRTGNSPTVITAEDLRKVAPKWAEFVARTEQPGNVKKSLGWLRDMYAYDLAAFVSGIKHTFYGAGKPESIMAQPPADEELGGAFILHYTWGPEIYDVDGTTMLWKFDKRTYGGGQYQRGPYKLVKLEDPPPWKEGFKLQTFFAPRAISENKHALIAMLITEINAAIDKLPRVPKGHDSLEEAQMWASN